jgi:hypothetical protein
MSSKKHSIEPEDIEVKDVQRRKFVMGATGTIVATGLATAAGCGGGGGKKSDRCNTDTGDPVVVNADPDDPISVDADLGDECDFD